MEAGNIAQCFICFLCFHCFKCFQDAHVIAGLGLRALGLRNLEEYMQWQLERWARREHQAHRAYRPSATQRRRHSGEEQTDIDGAADCVRRVTVTICV